MDAAGATRGSSGAHVMTLEQPTPTACTWNVTVESEILPLTLLRVGYVGTAGRNMEQWEQLNRRPTDWVWHTAAGLPLVTGEFGNVFNRCLNNTTRGDINVQHRGAYSDCNAAEFALRRRFSHGLAFQFIYVFSQAPGAGSTLNIEGRNWRRMRDSHPLEHSGIYGRHNQGILSGADDPVWPDA